MLSFNNFLATYSKVNHSRKKRHIHQALGLSCLVLSTLTPMGKSRGFDARSENGARTDSMINLLILMIQRLPAYCIMFHLDVPLLSGITHYQEPVVLPLSNDINFAASPRKLAANGKATRHIGQSSVAGGVVRISYLIMWFWTWQALTQLAALKISSAAKLIPSCRLRSVALVWLNPPKNHRSAIAMWPH